MIEYTMYDGTHEVEINKPDTRTKAGWHGYYEHYIDKEEWSDFESWWADMLRSGILVAQNL